MSLVVGLRFPLRWAMRIHSLLDERSTVEFDRTHPLNSTLWQMLFSSQRQFFTFACSRFCGGIRSSVFLRCVSHFHSVQRSGQTRSMAQINDSSISSHCFCATLFGLNSSSQTHARSAQQGAAPDRLQLRSFLAPLSAAGELGRCVGARYSSVIIAF